MTSQPHFEKPLKIPSGSFVPFLASLIVHLLLVLLLAIVVIGADGFGTSATVMRVEWDPASETNPTFEVVSPNNEVSVETSTSVAPSLDQTLDIRSAEPTLSSEIDPTTKLSVSNPVAELLSQIQSSTSTSSIKGAFTTTSLTSRSGSNRKQAVADRGGNAQSEAAVEAALLWIAHHQNLDGGWNLHLDAPCNGQCRHSSTHSDPQRAAATGLSLLAFLGAGYSHREGPYKKVVNDGLYFLMQIMIKDKRGGHFHQPLASFSMYEHGIATLALCEAYQMTEDATLRPFCEDAIHFIYAAQHTDGSWGYDPKTPGDLSIACWQMMAVKSAIAGKIQVPMDSIRVFDKFLDSQQAENGAQYGYRSAKPKPSTTSMGLLMRMYRGWPKTDGRIMRGAEYASRGGPSPNDVYLNYYTTQLLFHLEGPLWENWNPRMRDFLIREQAKEGHELGSWYFEHPLNQIGGRLYTTAMSCMTLEVYYRHMPIYGPIQFEPFEL